MASTEIERTSSRERKLHWTTTLSFGYCFFTGLGIAFPKFKWLLAVLGGGEFSAWLHPWAGLLFAVGALKMYMQWGGDMKLTDDDGTWLMNVKLYISGQDDKLPEAGKYNAGQKMYALIVFLAGPVMLLTGVIMWFPDVLPKIFARLGVVVHELLFIGIGAGFIVHVYMGTIGLPGTMQAMITGKVSALWAQSHHPRWFREITGRSK